MIISSGKVMIGGTVIHLTTEGDFLAVTSSNGFYSPAPLIKSGLKLVCNVNIVYGNLKPEISQDFAHKPQGNETVVHEFGLRLTNLR
jgi:hypothetical protein